MQIKEILDDFLPYQSIKQLVSYGNDTFIPCGLSFYTTFMLSCV